MALPLPVVAAAAAGAEGKQARSRLEVADVVRAYGEHYLRTHRSTAAERRVLRAIAHCRTAALGGHRQKCDDCGHERIAHNSCRNRHCPKCQGKEHGTGSSIACSAAIPLVPNLRADSKRRISTERGRCALRASLFTPPPPPPRVPATPSLFSQPAPVPARPGVDAIRAPFPLADDR